MARVLAATRLSHDTDASTSIEGQTESVTAWAKAHKHKIVKITTDTDISGALNPSDRPELGPWLKRIDDWDVLCVSKLDRLSRSLIDFTNLLRWCQENGKVIVSVAESLDFGTPTGKFVGQILILFAEFEREMMKDRRASAAKRIYAKAGYNGGGSLPWGYRTVKAGGQINVVPDKDLTKQINEIADAVIAGESVKQAAKRHGLDHASLLRRLRSPSLKGIVTLHGEIVRGADGMPIMREPVLPAKKWAQLQAKLDDNSKGAGVPRDASPWLHVIKCYDCGQNLYLQRYSKRPQYRYYTHKPSMGQQCTAKLNGWELEAKIKPSIMGIFGDSYIPEVIEIPAEDHSEELADIDQAIADWEAKAIAGEAPDSCARILDGLQKRREQVANLPSTPARTEIVESTDLFKDRWDSADDHGRGALLRDLHVVMYARKAGDRITLAPHQIREDVKPWPVGEV